ncbi:hypothetical protein COCSUDRAFT_66975 [Coccomyxa subellipsoidea C-169]|uniref:Uncharacterized protein n=1 Tax=Coccomyxa subellipsoidea (strain C-169) TaxID=574566 RepID=I0YT95_COCSC|nr:hypothetical protein COCSUDRAFT_66975 [Coccomyxa subellipsoidea C-169]EIE21614.1 hypothetical protein COCSUDRAFT_66975 [Coccomyxa subellipsoidea C-169]|eukprot:XP_005646158.1 hypothetical protein COCSUDRAFT_66975 [Coccomyxa subellipsoidea C-169]
MVQPGKSKTGNLQEKRVTQKVHKKEKSIPKRIPDNLLERQKRAKSDAVVQKLKEAKVAEEGVQSFLDSWRLVGLVRTDGKAEWSFVPPNRGRMLHSIPEVVRWFKDHLGGDGNERVQNGGPEANSSDQAHEVAPAANPASDDAMAGADAPGPAEDPPPPPPAEEAQTGGGEEAAGGDERDPGEAGAVGGGDGAAVNGLEEEAANALLYEHNAFKMGSSCLLVCLVRLGFTKEEALSVGVAVESWASKRIMEAKQAIAAAAAVEEKEGKGAMRAQKRKSSSSPDSAPAVAAKKAKEVEEDDEEEDEDVFNPRKDVVRNMTVLLRTEDSKSSEWRKPWSIAKVNRLNGNITRIDKANGVARVTWLKPTSEKQWWAQRWLPWVLEGKDSRGKPRLWTEKAIEIDSVQWGTHLTSKDTFEESDILILREEVRRLEADAL